MTYLDEHGNYDQTKVFESIAKIDDEIKELCETQETIDKSRLTRLRYEQMLRGLYIWK